MNDFYEICVSKARNCYDQVVNVSETFIFTCLSKSRIAESTCTELDERVEQEFEAFSNCLHLPENVQVAVKQLPIKHKKNFVRDRRRRRKLLLSKLRFIQNLLENKRTQVEIDNINNVVAKCSEIFAAIETFYILLKSEWSSSLVKTIFISGQPNCILTLNRLLLLVIPANNSGEGSAAYTLCPFDGSCDQHHCALFLLVLNILKSILNDDAVRSRIFSRHHDLIENLIVSIAKIRCYSAKVPFTNCSTFIKCKISILQILGGLCLFENGHTIISNTINRFAALFPSSKSFFQQILYDFTTISLGERELSIVKVTIISLINALLDKLDLESRMALRSELSSNNKRSHPKILDWLCEKEDDPALASHLELFRMAQQEDEEIYNETKDVMPDMESINLSFEDNDLGQLFENLSLSIKSQPNGHALRHILKLVFKQFLNGRLKNDSIDQFRQEQNELSQAETFNDAKLKSSMEYRMLKEKCERLSKKLSETEKSLLELQSKCNEKSIGDNQMMKVSTNVDMANCEPIYHSGSLSDNRSDEEASTSGEASIASGQVTTTSSCCPDSACPSSKSTDSPPPLPTAPALPPNVKDFFSFHNNANVKKTVLSNEHVFTNRNQLKTLNWTIIPETRLSGSLWLDFEDDSGTEDFIDVENLNKNFSNAKPTQHTFADNQSISTIRSDSDSVLNPRRAQNCQILLSKLKFFDINKLCTTIADLDPHCSIGKDMIEQLLKFIPNREEEEKLLDKAKNADLALVDQFFYCIIKNPNYERRLRCLWIMRTFDEKAADLKNQIEATIRASKLLQSSKRIRKILFAVLSLGNCLNRFKQIGMAKAFDVGALNRLIDVKSVVKLDYTLLHFLVDCCDTKSAEIFRLKKEISAFSDASKVCMTEIYSDLKVLDEGFDLLRSEAHESAGDEHGIPIQQCITEFLSRSESVLQTARVNLKEMHEQFELTLKALALDDKQYKTNPSELFGIFARFLSTFCDVRRQMKHERLEMEKRQATLTRIPKVKRANFQKQCTDMSMDLRSVHIPDLQKRSSVECFSGQENVTSCEFDNLVDALQSSEIFSGNIRRLRISLRSKNKRRTSLKTRDFSEKETRERLPKL